MSSPQYSQVADHLRHAILRGDFAPGSRLLTERALCHQYAVSRITIRQALALLEDERLIIRRQGSGTFVRQNPTRRIPLMIDYTGSVRDHAPNLIRLLLVSRRMKAPEWVADELHLPRETVILNAERLDRIEGMAVAWDEVFIPEDFSKNLTAADLARVDFLQVWLAREGLTLTACRQRIDAAAATTLDHDRLGLAVGSPKLKTWDTFHTLKNRPAGLFISHYPPEHVSINSSYKWTDVISKKKR
jgi:GntR family transcriptional regulator